MGICTASNPPMKSVFADSNSLDRVRSIAPTFLQFKPFLQPRNFEFFECHLPQLENPSLQNVSQLFRKRSKIAFLVGFEQFRS